MLTQAELKAQLNYNQDTGIFTWIKTNKNSFKKVGDIAGTLLSSSYINIGINKKIYIAHRLAWLYVYGYFPKFIDHINGNPSDNRLCNLRECTHSQNMCNRKLNKNNKSGFKGIFWNSQCNKWECVLSLNNKKIYLGRFNDLNDAISTIQKARDLYHGEFAKN